MSDEEKKNEEERWQKKAYQKLQPVIQNTKLISKQLDGYAIKIMELCAKFKSPPEWTKLIFWALIMLALCALAYVTILGIWHLVAKIHFLFFPTEINTLTDEAKKDNFNELRNALFILAALIGIPFFLWRTWIAQQQSNIADKQAETARDRAYTELFTKAIEQLGAEKPKKEDVLDENGKPAKDNAGQPLMKEIYVPNIEVRIGAIFALERIMKDSEKDAASVVDTLAAYVRENCGKPTLVCEIPLQKDFKTINEWLKAIKDYVGDVWSPGEGSLVARAHALIDQPQVNRADINTALTVIGRRPDWLKDPKKFKTQTPEMPDLRDVNFQGWDLTGFDLSWFNLSGAKMQGANMFNAKMQGANMSFAQMQGANMSGAKMQGANMFNAKMQGANMFNAKMQGADMSYAKMQGADMSYAKMQGADMSFAQIEKVQITSARKTAASVICVDFTKSKFEFHELQEQLPEMFGHKERTTLPKGMAIPEHWSEADMRTNEGPAQYKREWEAFKKKMGVE